MFGYLCWPCRFREHAFGCKGFFASYTGSPKSFVDGIHGLFSIHVDTLGLQVLNFLLTAQFQVSDRGDDFYSRNHDVEDHVKPDLVISCTCAAVGYSVSAEFLCMFSDVDGLAEALSTNTQGIGIVFEHIAIHQEPDDPVIVCFYGVYGGMGSNTQGMCMLFDIG